MTSMPQLSCLHWWLRTTSPKPFRAQNVFVTSQPNSAPRAPLGDSCTPNVPTSELVSSSSTGSDQSMLLTQYNSGVPSLAVVNGRSMRRTSSRLHRPSPMPPCKTRTRSATRHARGSWSKALWNSSNTWPPSSFPSLVVHSSMKPYLWFMILSSWFPLTSQTFSGRSTLRAKSKPTTSSWCAPRSTKSPLNTKCGPSTSSG
mmetsp:Transcript_25488/g.76611  ORF Transcript_25488/g.76611 Transcript_25488/m.76611 type:complete len:201 (-) Transcript_25488:740-1342(-)